MDTMLNCDINKVWTDILCCPQCHETLEFVPDKLPNKSALLCNNCKAKFPGIADSFDFTITEGERKLERNHYQQAYLSNSSSCPTDFEPEYWEQRWADPFWPECRLILDRLGDLNEKVVLCLGNGSSEKELHFLTCGARLICSDLSLSGVLTTKSKYNLDDLASRAAFHAIDACKIPLHDNSVDVVYGYEFVHHLSDLDVFFHEIRRVLKPDGLCIFFDNAYSPIWQGMKKTVLWPLMKLSHLLIYKRSPEDIRATYAGGYKKDFIQGLAVRHGFSESFFDSLMFFQYLFKRSIGTLLGWKLPLACYRIPSAIRRYMDRLLTDRLGFLQQSKMGLVWGFRR